MQSYYKRIFDLILAVLSLVLLSWILVICILIAFIDTKSFGWFVQERIGQFGKPFKIFKIKTMCDSTKKISSFGRFLRKSKIDELPQLLNILLGQMSFVGPRPDIPGYYDLLEGENRKILELKPGLTSEASIKYANEEELLNQYENPLEYNDAVIFPDKVKMNLEYYYKQSILVDLQLIVKTIFRA
ncbi:sugar transferase [Flavobacterium jejuense]|uniref:Sugar transferase n=1 Tax=Flavobacterium jejuense TaxID=1544455 RepID=A0ABX0IVP9_9FLAO|nr:sugar transferase [Flavobacterium jejuense]NHN26156.1 sugar transferase [Flavobacterium jejuense]